jgi:hypothetical protein
MSRCGAKSAGSMRGDTSLAPIWRRKHTINMTTLASALRKQLENTVREARGVS